MSSEPICQTLTFSGFGNLDPYQQSYDGVIVTKTCEWINGQIIFKNANRGYYVYYCAQYQDWRLALSNNNLAECQAFAKTIQIGEDYNPAAWWMEWNNAWQYSPGTVSCDTSNSITCGVAPETGSSDEIGIGIIIAIIIGACCGLGCCIFFLSNIFKRKRLGQEHTYSKPYNPAPALTNSYNQQTVATNPYNQQRGAGYNPAPSLAAPHDHEVAHSPYNPEYGVATRNSPHQHGEVEGQVEGQEEGGTAGYQPSAPPPPGYSAPPPGNNAPPAYY